MGYQIIIIMMLKKKLLEKEGLEGQEGYKCQAICQLSVTVYMIIND